MLNEMQTLALIVGSFSGAISVLYFIRDDKNTNSKLTSWVPSVGMFTGTCLYDYYFKASKNIEVVLTMICYTIAFGAFFSLIGFIYWLSARNNGITLAEIWNGLDREKMKETISNQQNEKIKIINLQEIETKKKELDEREKLIKEKEDMLRDSLLEVPSIKLRDSNVIPITQSFIDQIPMFAEKLSIFTKTLQKETDNYIAAIRNSIKEEEDTYYLDFDELNVNTMTYLTLICLYLNQCFINDHSARVHFRIRIKNRVFRKIAAVEGLSPESPYSTVSDIPYDKSMIERSFDIGSPAIKSLNPTHHFQGLSKGRWQDYISMAFNQIRHEGLPIFSMGIAFENPEPHKDMMRYLCQIRIDSIIQKELQRVLEVIDNEVLMQIYEQYKEVAA